MDKLGLYANKETGEFVTVVGVGSFRSGGNKLHFKKSGDKNRYALREDKFFERFRRPTAQDLMQ